MSLVIYFAKELLGVNYSDKAIPFYEVEWNESVDFKKELSFLKLYALENYLNYENAPVEMKTYLSIKYHPENVYDITYCSPQMVLNILKLKHGRIYAPYMAMNYVFVKKLEDANLDIEVATTPEGRMVHCNCLEDVLRNKYRVINPQESDDDLTKNVDIEETFVNVTRFSFESNLEERFNAADKKISVRFKIDDMTHFLLVGHTGDLAHDLITSVLNDGMVFGSDGGSAEMTCIDLSKVVDSYDELKARCLALHAGVFEILFSNNKAQIMVFDNIDEVINEHTEMANDFAAYLLKESQNTQFILFSRLISNILVLSNNARIADVKVKIINNNLDIKITGGDFLC